MAHELARSGVIAGDHHFTECVCGWRSADLESASAAGDALDDHCAEHGEPARRIEL